MLHLLLYECALETGAQVLVRKTSMSGIPVGFLEILLLAALAQAPLGQCRGQQPRSGRRTDLPEPRFLNHLD